MVFDVLIIAGCECYTSEEFLSFRLCFLLDVWRSQFSYQIGCIYESLVVTQPHLFCLTQVLICQEEETNLQYYLRLIMLKYLYFFYFFVLIMLRTEYFLDLLISWLISHSSSHVLFFVTSVPHNLVSLFTNVCFLWIFFIDH